MGTSSVDPGRLADGLDRLGARFEAGTSELRATVAALSSDAHVTLRCQVGRHDLCRSRCACPCHDGGDADGQTRRGRR